MTTHFSEPSFIERREPLHSHGDTPRHGTWAGARGVFEFVPLTPAWMDAVTQSSSPSPIDDDDHRLITPHPTIRIKTVTIDSIEGVTPFCEEDVAYWFAGIDRQRWAGLNEWISAVGMPWMSDHIVKIDGAVAHTHAYCGRDAWAIGSYREWSNRWLAATLLSPTEAHSSSASRPSNSLRHPRPGRILKTHWDGLQLFSFLRAIHGTGWSRELLRLDHDEAQLIEDPLREVGGLLHKVMPPLA